MMGLLSIVHENPRWKERTIVGSHQRSLHVILSQSVHRLSGSPTRPCSKKGDGVPGTRPDTPSSPCGSEHVWFDRDI